MFWEYEIIYIFLVEKGFGIEILNIIVLNGDVI